MYYEHKKHDGSLPIIGVNTFLPDSSSEQINIELARSTEDEKQRQIQRLAEFHEQHKDHAQQALDDVKAAIVNGENGFAALMKAVRHCSLGQITDALFEVGGQYRRNM